LVLRREVQRHYCTENSHPTLRLAPKPTGALAWRPAPTNIDESAIHLDGLPVDEEEWEDISVSLSSELLTEPNI